MVTVILLWHDLRTRAPWDGSTTSTAGCLGRGAWSDMQKEPPRCERCVRSARFRFAGTGTAPALRCGRHAVVYGPVFWRAVRVAAVVGTILFLINQLNVVLAGMATPLVVLKIVLTYLVPFLVAMYSALQISRLRAGTVVPSEAPPASPEAAA
jgi:hypothetical protein